LPCAAGAAPAGNAVLALRPEHVAIAPGGPARLRAVTYLGSQTEYHAELDGTPLVVVRQTPGATDPLRRLSPGDGVSLSWDAATARLLPANKEPDA
jgi:putative spermidine/putrescine transport system ATP-binding protein